MGGTAQGIGMKISNGRRTRSTWIHRHESSLPSSPRPSSPLSNYLPSNAGQLVTQFTTDSRARLFSACALQNLDFLTASDGRGSDKKSRSVNKTIRAATVRERLPPR